MNSKLVEWDFRRLLFIANKDKSNILALIPIEIINKIDKILYDSVDIKLNILKNINNNLFHLEKKKNNLLKRKENIESIIYFKCNHEWFCPDYYSGPYDKPDFICTKCNQIKRN